VITEYIQSLDMLKAVNDKLDLRSHYSQKEVDFISRLAEKPNLDELMEYWKSVVRVSFDISSGILTVEARAYSPEMAQNIIFEILAQSEDIINRMNDRVQADSVKLARREMEYAEVRYAEARTQLNIFRRQNTDINPKATAATRLGIIAGLEAKISTVMVELETQKQFLKRGSVPIRILQGNLAELQQQLEHEKTNVTGSSGPELLRLLEEYESLSIENEFSRNFYISTLTALEATRVQSDSKTIYLEAFQRPTLPDAPGYPDRVLSVLLVVVVICMGYALMLLVVAAVKEHIGV